MLTPTSGLRGVGGKGGGEGGSSSASPTAPGFGRRGGVPCLFKSSPSLVKIFYGNYFRERIWTGMMLMLIRLLCEVYLL